MSRADVSEMLRDPRFELLPFDGMQEQAGYLPEGAKVAVTASPEKGLEDTVERSEWLADQGFELSTHIAARGVESREHLEALADRLEAAGVEDLFVPGGDNEEPAGPYDSAYALLTDLDEMDYDFEIGITGYPEGHQFIDDATLWEHLEKKEPYGDYIVTQMSFSPEAVVDWTAEIRDRDVELPVHVGVPGVMKYQRLLSISQKIGVGDSLKYLQKTTGILDFIKQVLGSRGQYKPDSFVEGIAPYYGDDAYKIDGVHLYTFNQAADTEEWRTSYR
jgi:methylenetetrahydrofolate reductase (NADPH)